MYDREVERMLMTGKQRVYSALEGKPVDRVPVTVLYHQLYHMGHFAKLTGLPQQRMHQWKYATPEEHFTIYRRMAEKIPFEILQPQIAYPRDDRQNVEFFERDGIHYLYNRKTGSCEPLKCSPGHAHDFAANEVQSVFDQEDVRSKVRITCARDLIAQGITDYVKAAVRSLGPDHFILSGGVIGCLYSCAAFVGLTNLFGLLIEDPGLIESLSQRILERNVEILRALASAGGDALYIDDAMATSDMISVDHYERFVLPYTTEIVREIHRLGHKAILIYFGGIADRLEQIASSGADALSMETTMKNYTNDIGDIARSIGNRMSLFGNLDPVGTLQNGTTDELRLEIRRQILAGREARGFIMATGSPITPSTPAKRVCDFIDFSKQETGDYKRIHFSN